MKKVAVLALVAMISALAMGALSADAAKVKKYNTQVTINFVGGTYGDKFNGKVKSPNKKCRKGRTVVVKRNESGSDPKIGTDKSNKKGKWEVDVGGLAPAGKYYAIAKKKNLGKKNGVKQICKKARSKSVTVPA